ncbi:hypothetical protein Vretifemale_5755, partial [Volvox reticuliferus]
FHPDCQAAGGDEKVGRHPRQPQKQPTQKDGEAEQNGGMMGCGPLAEATVGDETASRRGGGEEVIRNPNDAATSPRSLVSGQGTPRGSAPCSSGAIPVSDSSSSDTLADDVSEFFEEAITRDEVKEKEVEPPVTLVMAQSHPGNAIRPGSSEEGPGGGKGSGDENP